TIPGSIPGYHLAAGDRPQQGAFGAAAPVDRTTGRGSGSSYRGYRQQPRGNGSHSAEVCDFAQLSTQLSPHHREVIDLVYYHEKSTDEVAEIIGVRQNTVKTRMFYARKRRLYRPSLAINLRGPFAMRSTRPSSLGLRRRGAWI